jgi:hypothetical protein
MDSTDLYGESLAIRPGRSQLQSEQRRRQQQQQQRQQLGLHAATCCMLFAPLGKRG